MISCPFNTYYRLKSSNAALLPRVGRVPRYPLTQPPVTVRVSFVGGGGDGLTETHGNELVGQRGHRDCVAPRLFDLDATMIFGLILFLILSVVTPTIPGLRCVRPIGHDAGDKTIPAGYSSPTTKVKACRKRFRQTGHGCCHNMWLRCCDLTMHNCVHAR